MIDNQTTEQPQEQKPFAKGSYFVWVRGNHRAEGQWWAELYYGVDSRLMKNKSVLAVHQLMNDRHCAMSLTELALEFPAPSFHLGE